jgi:hypothetical protein
VRIYSKFHDYYDIGLQYGIDPNCVYQRKLVELNDDSQDTDDIHRILYGRAKAFPPHWNVSSAFHLVAFCGKVYLVMEFSSTKPIFIYTYDALVKYIESRKDNALYKEILESKKNWFTDKASSIKDIIDAYPIERSDRIDNLHIKYGTPIIQLRMPNASWRGSYRAYLNPLLKAIEFYKAVDPVTAFQELSMYISGVMGGQAPPMVQVSDTIRLEKHGFDKVTSFRNM